MHQDRSTTDQLQLRNGTEYDFTKLKCDSHRDEQMLVAHCLLDPSLAKKIAMQVNPVDLWDAGSFRDCIVAIMQCHKHNDGAVTKVDILEAIEPILKNQSNDNRTFIDRYRDAEKDTRNGLYYLRRVVDRAGRRKLLSQLDPLALLRGTWSTADAIGVARETLLEIGREAAIATGRGGLLRNDYHENIETLHERLDGLVDTKFNSGFQQLDEVIGGFEATSYNIIGARPSIGKTAVTINLVLAFAKLGIRTMFVTLEVPYDKILELMACCHANIRKHLIHRAASQSTRSTLSETYDAIHQLPIELHSNCGDISQIVALCEDAVTRSDPVQAIFIDYAQIIRTKRSLNDLERLNLISRAFRELKQSHSVSLFLACQLNRKASEHRTPKLEDLKGTGDFEQDADVVMLLDRPNKETAEREEDDSVRDDQLDIYVRKNRHGRTGRVSYHWEGSTGVISEMDAQDRVAADRSRKREGENTKQVRYIDGSMETQDDLPF
jgi:replicative DNA helicase